MNFFHRKRDIITLDSLKTKFEKLKIPAAEQIDPLERKYGIFQQSVYAFWKENKNKDEILRKWIKRKMSKNILYKIYNYKYRTKSELINAVAPTRTKRITAWFKRLTGFNDGFESISNDGDTDVEYDRMVIAFNNFKLECIEIITKSGGGEPQRVFKQLIKEWIRLDLPVDLLNFLKDETKTPFSHERKSPVSTVSRDSPLFLDNFDSAYIVGGGTKKNRRSCKLKHHNRRTRSKRCQRFPNEFLN